MKMALLRLAENIPGIDYIEYRDKLYWNRFSYKLKFSIEGVRYLWGCSNPADLDRKISAHGLAWYSIPKQKVKAVKNNYHTLVNFMNWRNQHTDRKKVIWRVEGNNVSVFSNDLQLLKSVENVGKNLGYTYTQIDNHGLIGVKYFAKEPKHKFRVYLTAKLVTKDTVNSLREVINRSTTMFPSNALSRWLIAERRWNSSYCSASYCIDFDDESTLSYLVLMFDELVGHKFKLEKHPKIT